MQDGDKKHVNETQQNSVQPTLHRVSMFHKVVRRLNGFLVVGVLLSPAIFFFVSTIAKSLKTFNDETGASGWYLLLGIVLFALPALVSLICLVIGIIKFAEYDELE